MLGLVVSLLATTASPPALLPGGGLRAPAPVQVQAAAGEAEGDDSCEQDAGELYQRAELVSAAVELDGSAPDAPLFATPAVIDCRVPVVPALLQALVGECDGAARDASYRASRDPDSERTPNSLRPARHERAARDQLSACAGLPSEGGNGATSLAPGQPIALFALPGLPQFHQVPFSDGVTFFLPTGQIRLLERPPRA